MTALLLDISNLIWRTYHGQAAQQADAVPGCLRGRVETLRRQFQAEHVLGALDDRRNFRAALYPAYKGRRPEKSAELSELLGRAAELTRLAGAIPAIAPDHEADDVMATLAHRAPNGAVIVTSDRDLYGVVNAQVHVFDLHHRTRVTPEAVLSRCGVTPQKMALYKALCGDKADNIPGVRQLGPRGAAQIASLCSSVDEVFGQLEAFQPRYRKALMAADPQEIQLYHDLTTVRLDAPVVRVRRSDPVVTGTE